LVRLDANCLDCGERMVIEMKDEELLTTEPDTIVGYMYSDMGGTLETRPHR